MNDIDISNIKYNLYDILNVSPNDSIQDIKKKYIKTIKKFHPDKNSQLEEDIYHHIILGGQILTNQILKDKYDKIILNKIKTHDELKNLFIKDSDKIFDKIGKKNFEVLNNEYNNIHGYNNNLRISSDRVCDKENIHKNIINEYNNILLDRCQKSNNLNLKLDNNIYKQEINNDIIKVPSEITNYIDGEIFTYISDLNNLYINDSIQTSKFTSLDKAFILYSINVEVDNLPLTKKIEIYNNLTKELLYGQNNIINN